MSGSGSNELCYAVQTVNLTKSYEDKKCVLNQLSVHVKQGSIYGLLGSSGCGKTTLISCLLGLRKWEKGEVYLFGNNVANTSDGMGKFSNQVGYMPQELAIQDQLTPAELFHIYGSLYEMTKSEILEKSENLMKLLNLSGCKNRKVCKLSGGQQRRVSLAVTLLNTPKLLILDEPTVGVDPLLRVSIWNHLLNLCSTYKVTIVISTHYVEELRSADTVGIIRNGKLVAEHNPNTLMNLYSTSLLEMAVLKITRQDHTGTINPSNFSTSENTNKAQNAQLLCVEIGHIITPNLTDSNPNIKNFNNMLNNQLNCLETGHMKQINTDSKTHLVQKPLWKRFFIWWRQVLLYAFYMLISLARTPITNLLLASVPMCQIVSTVFVIGTQPTGIRFGIINNEVSNWADECAPLDSQSCVVVQVSCRFLQELKNLDKLTLINYNNSAEAVHDIKGGNLWGYLEIPITFTETMISRVAERQFVNNYTLDGALMNLQMDMADFMVTAQMFDVLRTSYDNLISGLSTLCDFDLSLLEYPIKQIEKPVYGKLNGNFDGDVVPPFIILIIVEFTVAFVPMALLNEYEKGSLQRIRVAGLSTSQAMVGTGMALSVITLAHAIICSVFAAFFSTSNMFESYLLVHFVTILITICCGIALGNLFACIVKDAKVCIVLVALYFPVVSILMGIIRPRSSIPYAFQVVSYYIPMVAIAESLKSVVNRGVGITHPTVYPGLVLTTVWFFILVALCYLCKRRLQT